MPVMIFLAGILSGVALRSIVSIPPIMLTALVLASISCFVYFIIISRKRKSSKALLYAVLFIFALALGACRFIFVANAFDKDRNVFREYKEKTFIGIIDEIPVEGDYSVSVRARVDHGYVLMRFEKGTNVEYGDKLSLRAQCDLPEDFETDTGTVFNYDMYLTARRMHHICKVSSLEIIEKNAGSSVQGSLYALREWFSGHVDRAFKDPHAGLVRGVLLGDKSGLTTELKSEMTVAGVIHIAVLSGSNIAMVAAIIFGISKSLPYNLRILLSITIVTLFILLSGAEPPAVRAGILVVIMLLGKFLHRTLHTGRALLLIAFIMVFYRPFALIYDMSFQLSFLATIGIVYVAPMLERYFAKVTERFGFREVLAGTMGAQITVTPLILYATGALSIVSLPANVLIGWAVPVLMGFGFFGGLLHAASEFVALPVVFLGEFISGYIVSVTRISAHLPYAQVLVPLHHPLLLCGMYAVLLIVLKRLKSVPRKVSN